MRNLIENEEERAETSNQASELTLLQLDSIRKKVNLKCIVEEKFKKEEIFWSFELFPTKNYSVYERFFREIQECSPLFYTLTWHVNEDPENHPSLELISKFPTNTLFHFPAKGLSQKNVENILNKALEYHQCNLLALKGDSTIEGGDFEYAADLIKYIRTQFDSTFSICVAGYPEMHPTSQSKELDLSYLKAKVDAGADFIITQIVFEAENFINFVRDCRAIGITVPIIPGIFPISNFKHLSRMCDMCKVRIPENIVKNLQPIKDNEEAVINFGVEFTSKLIYDIIKSKTSMGFHLFTLNRSQVALKVFRKVLSLL